MIYIQSFFLHRRAGEEPTPQEERPPTQLTNRFGEGEQTAQGVPTVREVFGAGLSPPQKQGCGLTAGEQQAREEKHPATAGRKKAGGRRAQLGPTPPGGTRGENTRHRTGTKHSRRRTERTGRQAPLPTDRRGAGRRTASRGE